MQPKLIPFATLRKRVLIVNCFFDEMRFKIGRNTQVPQAMGPVYLAGAFSSRTCEVRLYNEMFSGPLEDEELLAWPDMLVMTGLNTAFDRMLHLTAYARTKSRKVIIVAGGPAIRNLPQFSSAFFDYACLGDIEELQEVIEEAFGKDHVSLRMAPRYDLAYWMTHYGYVESSRYCNFKCAFCTLTGEGGSYQKYDLAYIRNQIVRVGKDKEPVVFIDNNFYGNDRRFFLDRLALIRELRRDGYIRSWAALVTNDFFYDENNLTLVKEAGCMALFSGLESFDQDWLTHVKKNQNTRIPQVEMIRNCLEQGILFLYGTLFDVTRRHLDDLRNELAFIVDHPDITLPSYLSIIVPILGTPVFYDCLNEGLILLLTKLRDLESTTLCVKPLDAIDAVTDFINDIKTLRGYRRRIIRHCWKFHRRYRAVFSRLQMLVAMSNAIKIRFQVSPNKTAFPNSLRSCNRRRTYLSTTEIVDDVYQPAFRVDGRFERYFRPTLLTDVNGDIAEELQPDIYRPKAINSLALTEADPEMQARRSN